MTKSIYIYDKIDISSFELFLNKLSFHQKLFYQI